MTTTSLQTLVAGTDTLCFPTYRNFPVEALRDLDTGDLELTWADTEYPDHETAVADSRGFPGAVVRGRVVRWAPTVFAAADAGLLLAFELADGRYSVSLSILHGKLQRARFASCDYKLGEGTLEIDGVWYALVRYTGRGRHAGKSDYVPVPLLDRRLRLEAEARAGCERRRRNNAFPEQPLQASVDVYNQDRDRHFKAICNERLATELAALVKVRQLAEASVLLLEGSDGCSFRALRAAAPCPLRADVPNLCADTCDKLRALQAPGLIVHPGSLEEFLARRAKLEPPPPHYQLCYADFCGMLHGNQRALELAVRALDPCAGSLLAVTLYLGRGALQSLRFYAGDKALTKDVFTAELAWLVGRERRASLLWTLESGNMCCWLFRLYGAPRGPPSLCPPSPSL